jgi:peptidoglycan/xylan/chitin deacetylase (PgdA/CDA1 family)
MTRASDSLYVAPGSEARAFAEGLGWLWRVPVRLEPGGGAVGFGVPAEAAGLRSLVRGSQLAAAAVLVGAEDVDDHSSPRARVVAARADLHDGSVKGRFVTFDEGRVLIRSRLGAHAVEQDGMVYLGAGTADWGAASAYWVFGAVADLLRRTLTRPLVVLPPLGCVRLDDVPGTGLQQLTGRAHPDGKMARRIRTITRRYREADAQLVVAIASEAFVDGSPAPLDAVWPDSVAALRDGVRAGVLEPACHGTLHVDVEALGDGTVEPREFRRLDQGVARSRIESASAWLTASIGEPRSFVAPAWGYSPGTLAAAAEFGLPTWRAPAPGPLLDGLQLFETTRESLAGVSRVDYRYLSALAAVGVPPTIVLHGRLLDHRRDTLELPGDAFACVRLVYRPDVFRLPTTGGLRWVGAQELVDALRAHGETELARDGRTVVGPGSSRVLA